MKKKILAVMLCVGFCSVLNAQTPPTPGQGAVNNADAITVNGDNKQFNTPIVPATLLLLGLGASAVGYKVHRNQKQKKY